MAADFFSGGGAGIHREIAKRGGVEDDGRGFGKFFQFLPERGVGGKWDHLHVRRNGMGGHFSAQTKNVKAAGVQGLAENGAEFAGGVIGDATNVIDRLMGRSAGHKGEGHGFHSYRSTRNAQL